jgi:hypothetical protein
MVERFGMQDHDAQLTQHALQNPTNRSSFQNIDGGEADAAAPTSGGYFPGPRMIVAAMQGVHAGRRLRPRGMLFGIVLALIFGPFGLIYASWTGALVLTGLTAAAGYITGGGMAALDSDTIMQPIWRLAVVASVIWMIVAIRTHNARLRSQAG